MKLKTLTLCIASAIASSSAMAFFDSPTIVKDGRNPYPKDLEVEREVYELDKDALEFIDLYRKDGAIFTSMDIVARTPLLSVDKAMSNIPVAYEPDSGHAEDLVEEVKNYLQVHVDTFETYIKEGMARAQKAIDATNKEADKFREYLKVSPSDRPKTDNGQVMTTKYLKAKIRELETEATMTKYNFQARLNKFKYLAISEVFTAENGFDSDAIEDIADAKEDAQDAADDHMEDLFEEVFGDVEDDGEEDYAEIEYSDYDGIILVVDRFKVDGQDRTEMFLIKTEELEEKTDELDLEDSKINLSKAMQMGLVYATYDQPMYSPQMLDVMQRWLEKSN